MRHPQEEELLRYADGELPVRRAGEVRVHLEACWQCRTALEELHRVIGECVHYRKDVLQGCLPLPPAPWGDIYRQFDRIDASIQRATWWERVRGALAYPVAHARRWAPAAAVLAVAAVLVYQLRETPSVQAAQLLQKAAAAAGSRAEAPRRIQIRTRTHRVTRSVGTRPLAAKSDQAVMGSLQTLFEKAHYNWEDPLSARSYQAWRDQLRDKRDEVTTIRESGEQDCYRIRTTTDSGELREATLKLAVNDLRPVEGRLEFRNQEWVEITELAVNTAPAPEALASSGGTRPTTPEPHVASAPAVRPSPAATLGDELQVMAVLHQVGADLGDPIEVTRSGGRVLVSGIGVAPERRRQLEQALAAMPHVELRFAEPAAEPWQPQPPSSGEASATPADSPLQARIEKQLGGRPQFEQIAAQLVDMSENVMSRAYALRRLAQRFPAGSEAELGRDERQLLLQLNQEHTAVLARQVHEMERLLKPVLAGVGGSAAGARENVVTSRSWQPAAEELFRAARHLETLVAALLGATAQGAAGEQLPSQVLAAVAELRAGAERYRLTAAREGGNGVQ